MNAGMGCPDWPKCFDSYIPPTSGEGLPDNYQDFYRQKRIEKNRRLAKVLNAIGYESIVEDLTSTSAVLAEQEFDATKAWIEYLNRLVGVVIGLAVFVNMIFAFSWVKSSKWIPTMGVLIFLLTGFQGWIGSLVVSTNLLHGFITVHMLLALLIVALLIWMNFRVKENEQIVDRKLFFTVLVTFLVFIPQVLLGTEVRGAVDELLLSDISRFEWASYLPEIFLVHRSYSWLVLIGTVLILIQARKLKVSWLLVFSRSLTLLVVTAMFAGIGMVRLGFAFWLQPLHLIVAVGIFSILFYLILRLKVSE